MHNKSQAALEFLMTYGWVIMVVLLAIGALSYFGVLSLDNFVPRRCALEPGIACMDFKVNENSITLVLRTARGEDITMSSIKISGCTGTASGFLRYGGEVTYTINGCDNIVNKKFIGEINITYTGETGLTHKNRGNIVGKVEGSEVGASKLSCDENDIKASWHLDESSGSVIDSSPCGNNGNNMGATQGMAGKIGNAYSFNGNDNYISIPASESLNISGGITILMWIRPAVNSSQFHNGWSFFIYQRNPLKYETGYYNTGGPRFKPYNEVGTNFDFSAGMKLLANTWYHVAFVRQGTFLGIYVNGTLAGSRNDFTGNLRSSKDVRIGGNGGNSGFQGAIDEVVIYNRALSANEILTRYQSS